MPNPHITSIVRECSRKYLFTALYTSFNVQDFTARSIELEQEIFSSYGENLALYVTCIVQQFNVHVRRDGSAVPRPPADAINSLRPGLERCRTILKVLNAFGLEDEDIAKNTFVACFNSLILLISREKARRVTDELVDVSVRYLQLILSALHTMLQARAASFTGLFGTTTFKKLVRMSRKPGRLERFIEANDGKKKYAERIGRYVN